METVELQNGYDRSKHPETIRFRRMNEEDIDSLVTGGRYWFEANDGSARQVTIASRIKRWKKKTPMRNYTLEFSVKYGLREYDRWRNCGCGDDDISRLLIRIDQE